MSNMWASFTEIPPPSKDIVSHEIAVNQQTTDNPKTSTTYCCLRHKYYCELLDSVCKIMRRMSDVVNSGSSVLIKK